jgi:DNA-binding MarR family transcriptional regulator
MLLYAEADFLPDRSIGYLTRRVHQLGVAALDPVFSAEGMNGLQWSALASVWAGRCGTAAELARDLGHDKGATTRLVDTLEERGWLVRERSGGDRRRIDLRLTAAGEAITRRCRRHVVDCWNAWLADWPRAEAETLIALLGKLRDSLERVEAPCS